MRRFGQALSNGVVRPSSRQERQHWGDYVKEVIAQGGTAYSCSQLLKERLEGPNTQAEMRFD